MVDLTLRLILLNNDDDKNYQPQIVQYVNPNLNITIGFIYQLVYLLLGLVRLNPNSTICKFYG